MMPWTLKFLWSPFLEMFKTKKFFVVLTQMVTGAGFALVALALQLPFFFAICIALLAVIAFSGATHDVATDGVYMSELNKQDQAKYIGWQGAFYNIAKIVASGGLVWLAGALLVGFGGVEGATEAVRHEATRHAWMTVMLILAAVMLLLGFYHMRMLPSGGAAASGAKSARETWEQLVAVIKDFFLKKHIWYYIAFIILYRLAEGFVMKIVPLFLKAERSAGELFFPVGLQLLNDGHHLLLPWIQSVFPASPSSPCPGGKRPSPGPSDFPSQQSPDRRAPPRALW